MQCTRELFSSFLTFLIALLVFKYLLSSSRKKATASSQVNHKTLSSVKELLSSIPSRISDQLFERASANTRLVPFLGLTNTFVDPSESTHHSFRKHSLLLLKNVQSIGLNRLHDICTLAVHSTMEDYQRLSSFENLNSKDVTVPFDQFIQIVVLRTIISSLLSQGQSAEDLDFESLRTVSSDINLLWTLSKSTPSPPPHLFQELHQRLRHLLPPATTGFSNPIDFVVPTWETTWRVCATTIARAQESVDYRKAFEEFHTAEHISTTDFDIVQTAGFSIKNFVDEVMRLHPPVKHIARRISPLIPESDGSGKGVILCFLTFLRKLVIPLTTHNENLQPTHHVADIHSVLRSEPVWSSDAQAFKPERHQETMVDGGVAAERKDSLKLVFGWGSLRCIASTWAPNAVAVISSVIIGECKQLGWEVEVGKKIGGREGWDGWNLVRAPK